MLPLAAPGLIALTILSVQGIWNEFLHPLIAVPGAPELATLPLGLANVRAAFGEAQPWNTILAGSLITTIPIAIVFFVFQRYFVQGGGRHRGQGLSRLLRTEVDKVVIDTSLCRAVIFDIDGVVTDSVPAHRQAWQEAIDAFLDETGSDTPRFAETDYLTHVDGKPRYDGVRDFLGSRDIVLPDGTPGDSPEAMTVCGLGNRKNQRFLELPSEGGVEAYQSTIDLIGSLRAGGVGLALITSSRNAAAVLGLAGVDQTLFDAIVDGNECSRLGLAGKPDPAIFIEAARRLDVEPANAVVVEDAISGVEAGRAGEFGGVLGVDRAENRLGLVQARADGVIDDLNLAVVG
jgi:alpha,alpha-trehalase